MARTPERLSAAEAGLPGWRARLPAALRQLLDDAARAAGERGWCLYAVGGAVRDWLLAPPQAPLGGQELDLVADGCDRAAEAGAGLAIARALHAQYPEARLQLHEAFQTAALHWHAHPVLGSLELDVATARREVYPHPAANPEVEPSAIGEDLARRDFSINALALGLNGPNAGMLLDRFGGLADLQVGRIRTLHADSFIDDPTRIYRAVKYATRLGFALAPETAAAARRATASGTYERYRSGRAPALQARLGAELQAIVQAPHWQLALRQLAQLDALRCLHPQLSLDAGPWRRLRRLARWLPRWDPQGQWAHGQLRLEALLAGLPPDDRPRVAAELALPGKSRQRLAQLQDAWQQIRADLSAYQARPERDRRALAERRQAERGALLRHQGQHEAQPPRALRRACEWLEQYGYLPSEADALLRPYGAPLLLLVGVRLPPAQRRAVWCYGQLWSWVESPLSGRDLKALGYAPGPQFGQLLGAARAACLDGVIGDAPTETEIRNQAIAYLQACSSHG